MVNQVGEDRPHTSDDRKSANEKLGPSHQNFAPANDDLKQLLESTPVHTIILDAGLKIRAFTTPVTSIRWLIPGDAGPPISDLKLKIDYDWLAIDAQAVLDTLAPVRREARASDGKSYEVRILPYRTTEGTCSGVVVAFTDLTVHTQIEQESRRFATIVRDSNDAISVVNLDGRILSWNHGAERMYGYCEAEATAMSISQLVPEASRKDSLDLLARLARGETVASFETQRVTRDGRTLDVWLTATAIVGKSGKPVAIAQTDRDITERKRAEEKLRRAYAEIGLQYEERNTQLAGAIETIHTELANRARVEQALRESQGRLSVVFNTASEGIITINGQGIIDSFNPAAERIFGYLAEEVVGKEVGMLIPPPHKEMHQRYIVRYLETGEKSVIGSGREVTGLRKDGTIIPIELNIGEGTNAVGPVFTGIVRDLTQRKESESRLRSAERLATIGTLAAGLGHDMNNVLLPVQAHLNAAFAAATPKVRREVKRVQKNIDYLQQLADGLHFLAADPEKPNGTGSREGTDLTKWWLQTGAMLSKPVPRHVRVVSSIPAVQKRKGSRTAQGRLPKVAIAPHRLTQAMLNLVVNAGQAFPPPNERAGRECLIRIEASLVKAGKSGLGREVVRLSVRDDGVGMTEEVKRRAFDMFFTTKPRGMGTGLGLPLVERLVKNAGGSVEIESRPGKGTTIILNLPVAEASRRTKEKTRSRSAVICVSDLRAASLTRQLLEAAGIKVSRRRHPGHADLWIVEPRLVSAAQAGAWQTRPTPRSPAAGSSGKKGLVVMGPLNAPQLKAWKPLDPVVVDRPDDYASLRAAIGRVIG